jgi:putative peptidoglycan lipid II flippase
MPDRRLAAVAPAAHETTTATQQDAVESEFIADVINRPVATTIARNTLIVALAFIASRILGFLREILIAHRFGTGGEADAYAAAFRVPDLLFLVVMSASFGSAFIPVFAGFFARGEDDRGWDLANAVLTWTIAITVVVGALIFVLADPIIRYLIAPSLDEASIRLAADLMRVLVLSPLLLGIGIAAKGMLESQDRFLMPALAPLVYNVGIIVGIVTLAPAFGIRGVAVGVIVGAAGHALIQLPSVLRSGLRFRPTLDRRVEGLAEVGRLLVPRVVGQAAFAANFIVVTNVASQLGEGGPSSINYAWQLLMLPHGILALSVSTVIFPAMARQWERRDVGALGRTFQEAVRPLIFLSVPVALILFLYREPIVAALLQRGDFTRASTVAVALPLAALAASLVAYALVEVLTRAFYAMKDAKTPVAIGLVVIVINVAIALLTIDTLEGLALGLALGISTTVEAVVLAAILIVRLRALGVPSDGSWPWWLGRLAIATGVAAAFGFFVADALQRLWAVEGATFPVRLGLLLVAVLLVAIPFGLTAWALALPEIAMLERRVARLAQPLAARLPRRLVHELGISRGVAFDRVPVTIPDVEPDPAAGEFPEPDADVSTPGERARARASFDDEPYYRPAESRVDERRRRPPARRPLGPEAGYVPLDDFDDDRPFEAPRSRPADGGYRPAAGTGRFGSRPPLPSRRPANDPYEDEVPSSRERGPFRSTQQTRLPDWYTPERRNRRPNGPTDYTDGSDGRSRGPRHDR